MRTTIIIAALAIALLSAVAALAYTPYSYGGYASSAAFNYHTPSQTGTMYGYGQGYSYFGNGVMSGYSTVDGYRLTEYGPYPYPPNARFVSDTQFRGHYNAWTGQYYDAWNGRTVSQYPRQSGGVPAYNYPKNPYIINRQSYW